MSANGTVFLSFSLKESLRALQFIFGSQGIFSCFYLDFSLCSLRPLW